MAGQGGLTLRRFHADSVLRDYGVRGSASHSLTNTCPDRSMGYRRASATRR